MGVPFLLRMETLEHCPLCSGTTLSPLRDVPDHESGTGVYRIDICVDCGLAFTNPRPLVEELPRLYAQRTTTDFAPGGEGLAGRLRRWRLDRYVRNFPRSAGVSPARMRLLDFGCGDGNLALVARRAGLEVEAVDFHALPPPVLIGSAIGYRSIDAWQSATERYDIIVLRHVLEHHPAPVELLGQLRSRLMPHGTVAVEVPNRRSVWARIFGSDFFAYYVPRHLFHFDRDSLARTFAAAGFARIRMTRGHTPLIGHSLGYRWRREIDNLGLLGLASFPAQILADVIIGESSTLHVVARIDD